MPTVETAQSMVTVAIERDRLIEILLAPGQWASASSVHAGWVSNEPQHVEAGERIRERVALDAMPLTGVPWFVQRPFRAIVRMIGGGFEISWEVVEVQRPASIVLSAAASVGGDCRLRFDLDALPGVTATRVAVLLELSGEPNNPVVRRFLGRARPVRRAAARALLAEVERSLRRL